MNPSIPARPISPPARRPYDGKTALLRHVRHALLPVAAVMAASLLMAYVQVCHDAVERGERWRAEQRALADAATPLSAAATRRQ